jgi:nucleotide-binding universal stress UspA family protein
MVPYDFTETSESALDLAMDLARSNNGSVFLLHVVNDRKDKPKVRHQFKSLISKMPEADQKLVSANVINGTGIYDEIGKASDLLRPSLIVLGTKGAKGLQKILGSHVEKIISYSYSPVLVTQGKKKVDRIKNIVMPFNFSKESLQVTTFAGSMAQKFDAKMHLVAEHEGTEIYEEKVVNNQSIVKNFMSDNGVACEIADLPKKKSYGKELMQYAGDVEADMIAITYTNDHFLNTSNHFIQNIIENDLNIPVLTVNSEELSQTYY